MAFVLRRAHGKMAARTGTALAEIAEAIMNGETTAEEEDEEEEASQSKGDAAARPAKATIDSTDAES
jgi:hypothetical protein